MWSQLSFGPDGIFPKEKRRRRNRVDGNQRSTSKQSNSGKKVMEKNDDQTDDDLAAIQKATEIAIGAMTHHTKTEKEKIIQNTSDVRVREEAQQRSQGKQQSSGHISDKNRRRDNIPPNAQRKVGGVEFCGVYVWIYTDAVLCDGQRRQHEDLRQMFVIIMECVSWVWEDTLW